MKKFLVSFLLSLIAPVALVGGPSELQSPAKIYEIVLEGKGGMKLNPLKFYGAEFKVSFPHEGMALYAGSRDVKLIGSYQGTVSNDEFQKLVRVVVDREYLSIPTDAMQASQTPTSEKDGPKPKTIITITYEGGQKTIWRYTELSQPEREKVPKAVFEIEQAILDASSRIKWREVE